MVGGGLFGADWRIVPNGDDSPRTSSGGPDDNIESFAGVEALAVEVGIGLIGMLRGGANSPLLQRIGEIRTQVATDLGFVLPPVRVSDNLSLKAGEYQILLKGTEISRFKMPRGCELAIRTSNAVQTVEGVLTRDPVFGMSAMWVAPDQAARARASGCLVIDALTVLSTHISELARQHAYELLSPRDVSRWLERVGTESPALEEAALMVPVSTVQRILQNLLRERVPIRDGCSIVQALSEGWRFTKNPVLLTEYVRQNIPRQVVSRYVNSHDELPAFVLDPALEQTVQCCLPPEIDALVDRLRKAVGTPVSPVVLLTSAGLRRFIRDITENTVSNLAVLSHSEVPACTRVRSLGVIQ